MKIKNLPKLPGVYAIFCIPRETFYVGSSVNIARRAREHRFRLNANEHDNTFLQRAWNKHGSLCFKFIVLEESDDLDRLFALETHWLEHFRKIGKVFNMRHPDPGAPMSDKIKAKISRANKGQKRSEEFVRWMSDYFAHSYPRLENIETGEVIPPGKNIRALSRRLGLNTSGLQNLVNGRANTCGRWKIASATLPEHHNAQTYPSFRHRDTGEIIQEGSNLSELCRDYNLDVSAMTRVINKAVRHHKGWELIEMAGWSREGRTPETKKRISLGLHGHEVSTETRQKISEARGRPYPAFKHRETGEIIPSGTSLRSLCIERGLDNSVMGAVAKGRVKHHKGWELYERP